MFYNIQLQILSVKLWHMFLMLVFEWAQVIFLSFLMNCLNEVFEHYQGRVLKIPK